MLRWAFFKRKTLYNVAKYFPETPRETPQLIWCIFVYRGKGTSTLVEY